MYREHNSIKPHLVDTLSYEGMNLITQILKEQDFSKREEMEKRVLSFSELEGMTSKWKFDNGLWLKNMDMLEISSSGFTKINSFN